MLIEFGLAQEAADVFQGLLKRGPPDASEYDGLGNAEFALANYRAAGEAFRKALELDASDQVAARRAQISDQILALDPSQRGLSSRERYRRSQQLLIAVLTRRLACDTQQTGDIAEARAALARKNAPSSFSDAADANVLLAERLFNQRPPSCPAPDPDDPLTRIMSKLANR